jgi:predicted enzyme related to lactoylglutathione lyase
MAMNPVVHFEFPGDDTDRMAEFYTKAFGWQINKMGPEYGGYLVVMTSESDANGPKEKGMINGGFYKKSPGAETPTLVISVDDIHEAMRKIEEAGGKVVGGSQGAGIPDDIPGVGQYVSFLDTEGNRIAVLQPAPRMGEAKAE